MKIEDFHYDFKQKLNKIDSQKYRNLRIPEIDWKLNEAVDVYIKQVAQPHNESYLGFEVNQRTIDNIRTIVVENYCIATYNSMLPNAGVAPLPQNYMYHLSSYAECTKQNCTARIRTHLVQHDDEHEESPFDKSSFEWRNINMMFVAQGVKLINDGTFVINNFCMDYIRKHAYMHFAQGTQANQYQLPDGTLLVGKQECELPEHTHREIVDIAVLIATGDLQIPDYQTKEAKTKLY